MMLMMNAAKNYSVIQSTTNDLADSSKEFRDFEIARNERAVGREITLLATITLIGIVIGCVVSFLIGRGIAKPRHRHHECDQAHGGRRFRYRVIRPRHGGGGYGTSSSPGASSTGRSPFARKTRWACSPTPSARCRAELQEIVAQTRVLIDATDEGQLGVRADATRLRGRLAAHDRGTERPGRCLRRTDSGDRRLCRPHRQGRHPAQDRRDLSGRLQRHQGQLEPLHRRGAAPGRRHPACW